MPHFTASVWYQPFHKMNMKHTTTFVRAAIAAAFAILLIVPGMSSCKKDNAKSSTPVTNTPKTKTDMLVAATWKLTAATVSPAMFGSTDAYAMLDACEKDNTIQFKNDASKTMITSEGSNVCSGREATSTSNWLFQNDETELLMGSDTYKLKSFGEKGFTGTKEIMMGGTLYSITCTYSAQ